jgi:type VI secretion system secreted protein Hcp
MAFNAYLVFKTSGDPKIKGESSSEIAKGKGAVEISDYSFGVTMPVTASRSDGGGATVGRANFDVFTCNKGIDTSTPWLVQYCCKGTSIPKIVLHLYRQGEGGSDQTGVVKYAMVVFQHCVITKVGITGGGDELPKESLEFNYGLCEYSYKWTDHETGKYDGATKPDGVNLAPRFGWSTVENKQKASEQDFDKFEAT